MRKNYEQVSGLQNPGFGFDFNGDIIILTIPPIASMESSFGTLRGNIAFAKHVLGVCKKYRIPHFRKCLQSKTLCGVLNSTHPLSVFA